MKIMVLGADGYLGWPTCMHLSARGHQVAAVDNGIRRHWDTEGGFSSLTPISSIQQRVVAWEEVSGHNIPLYFGDITDWTFLSTVVEEFKPDAIVHYAEHRAAPFSMIDRQHAVLTQTNNLVGTLNVLYAIKDLVPNCHLIKLGTMGEYGTPNIDIEEGFLEIEHNGRKETIPFPKSPGSFYHLSKVHDSNNMMFASRVWGISCTDLNQGIVYGAETDETRLDPRLVTRFDYDHVWGTALNRFCVQAVAGHPITVYGKGGQTRGFLNIRDTVACVELAAVNPPEEGQFRVFNQFTEQFSVIELANMVAAAARSMGLSPDIQHIANPRVEKEVHYYNAKHSKLEDLGLDPHLLGDELVTSLLGVIRENADRIDSSVMTPTVNWA